MIIAIWSNHDYFNYGFPTFAVLCNHVRRIWAAIHAYYIYKTLFFSKWAAIHAYYIYKTLFFSKWPAWRVHSGGNLIPKTAGELTLNFDIGSKVEVTRQDVPTDHGVVRWLGMDTHNRRLVALEMVISMSHGEQLRFQNQILPNDHLNHSNVIIYRNHWVIHRYLIQSLFNLLISFVSNSVPQRWYNLQFSSYSSFCCPSPVIFKSFYIPPSSIDITTPYPTPTRDHRPQSNIH